MYTTNYTVQNLCYTSSQYMSAEHNTEWQKQKNWKDRNKNFNRTLSCWCVCVCVHAHMHTYSQTDRVSNTGNKDICKNLRQKPGEVPTQQVNWTNLFSALEAVSRAQQSMNLWHFEVHSHDVKDLSHVCFKWLQCLHFQGQAVQDLSHMY